MTIRQARSEDCARLAEIEVFNYRLNFYPIFQNDDFYFGDLQTPALMAEYQQKEDLLQTTCVYDDGAVKGFVRVRDGEIVKLFVEPVLQGRGIGAALLEYAVREKGARFLWALEKNTRAIAFYQRHGFMAGNQRKLEEDTTEYLVCMHRQEELA